MRRKALMKSIADEDFLQRQPELELCELEKIKIETYYACSRYDICVYLGVAPLIESL